MSDTPEPPLLPPDLPPDLPPRGGALGAGPSDMVPVTIEEEMQTSYLAYAMSVIVSRALPDVRDGLKPVHRRILYSMRESGFTHDKPYRKSARAVGDVMGKYHPHGDSSIYDAMVRMAQSWSMRVRLIDGQGNFGSVDGDSPAAMRYTEARLARAAMFLLDDIDRDTVDFQANYDESEEEPRVLPAAYPNLLINGASGIAVGMATNIPTAQPGRDHRRHAGADRRTGPIARPAAAHRAGARLPDRRHHPRPLGHPRRLRDRPRLDPDPRPRRHRGPEARPQGDRDHRDPLPGEQGDAAGEDRRARAGQADRGHLATSSDESDRSGMRLVIEIKREATPEVVLNQLYRFTQLQTSFGVNMLALNEGQPKLMGLREVLLAFIAFREEVVLRRARFELGRARDRGHLLVGLVLAVANIDAVIALIRAAPDAATARESLMARAWDAAEIAPLLSLIDDEGNVVEDGRVRLTEAQARGILELRLQRLTGLERERDPDRARRGGDAHHRVAGDHRQPPAPA